MLQQGDQAPEIFARPQELDQAEVSHRAIIGGGHAKEPLGLQEEGQAEQPSNMRWMLIDAPDFR